MNYKELGFKCGLEIHQQLEGKKLFCNCPTTIKKEKADFIIIRRLRAAAGETGSVDKAAAYETKKSKEFEYRGYADTSCLVETDEEPPHPVNLNSLKIALIVAKLLNIQVVDSIQFMRKTVIDGSNVSGFQRTALIGQNGWIKIKDRKIRIDSLCLEEEAAQVIKRTEKKDIYNISRLGIPLLEIATAPDILSPEECKETAAKIGMILRSVNGIKRGIGSIRQDVNVSIKGGARIEVKGFQDIKNIPSVIDNEINRQIKLIKNNKFVESCVRKAEADESTSYLRPMPGADRMYPETDIPLIIPDTSNIKVPETLAKKEERYVKEYNLSKDLALLAVKFESKNNYCFEKDFETHTNISANTIIDILLVKAPTILKKANSKINLFEFKNQLLNALNSKKISLSAIEPIILDIINTGKFDPAKYAQLDEEKIKQIIKQIIDKNKGAQKGLLMGKIMKELQGKADGKKVMEILNLLM